MVEVFLNRAARRWCENAKTALESMASGTLSSPHLLAASLLAAGYLVTSAERADALDAWALTLGGYWWRPRSGPDQPALEIRPVERASTPDSAPV